MSMEYNILFREIHWVAFELEDCICIQCQCTVNFLYLRHYLFAIIDRLKIALLVATLILLFIP